MIVHTFNGNTTSTAASLELAGKTAIGLYKRVLETKGRVDYVKDGLLRFTF